MVKKSNVILGIFAVMVLVSLTVGIVSAAPVTQNITYQGKLTDAAGNPLTGSYTVTFNLYEVSSGGTVIAADTHTVQASKGLFTTQITADQSFFDGRALWLGVKVGTDPEMTPRQELRPVPYALSLRPGSLITRADGNSALNLETNGGGRALTVSASGLGSYGVYALTSGSDSIGFETFTQGPNSHGVRGVTKGENSQGLSAYTSGFNSPGVYAYTGGNQSHGVAVSTVGNGSNGVDVYTTGYNSLGLMAWTKGDLSYGVRADTEGQYSHGLETNTKGDHSSGVRTFTSGPSSDGVFAYTNGDQSNGVSSLTYGSSSSGVFSSTMGSDSPAVQALTYHDNSIGVNVTTKGFGSKGVFVVTAGQQAAAVHAIANGPQSNAIVGETSADGPAAVAGLGHGTGSYGVFAVSDKSYGLYADTGRSDQKYGIYTPDYLYAKGTQVPAADVAEYMPVSQDVTPGTVLIIGPEGKLQPSTTAYDTKVAGIVSTDPGVTLGTKENGNPGEQIIAVAGRVPCKVDATIVPIHAGDLLTTSDNPGYAMKAEQVSTGALKFYLPGTVIGKAMGTLESGTGTIEVLVTLQ
jgi:hypothetical protein